MIYQILCYVTPSVELLGPTTPSFQTRTHDHQFLNQNDAYEWDSRRALTFFYLDNIRGELPERLKTGKLIVDFRISFTIPPRAQKLSSGST